MCTQLVVTGRDPIPVEIDKGVVIRRCDLKTMQDEADVSHNDSTNDCHFRGTRWGRNQSDV